MSEWHNPKASDIAYNAESKEVDIFVTQNYFGSVYLSITFEQIKEMYKHIVELK